jgi:hypothetical protein
LNLKKLRVASLFTVSPKRFTESPSTNIGIASNPLVKATTAHSSTNGFSNLILVDGDSTARIGDATDNEATLSFLRFNKFKSIYNQYKVSAVQVSVTGDINNLENPIMFITEKGGIRNAADGSAIAGSGKEPLVSIKGAMSQPHKQYTLNDSRRTCKYGYKPSTSDEKQYNMLHSHIIDSDLSTIKILQGIESKPAAAPNNSDCRLRVNVMMKCVLKDSKTLN